MKIDLVAPMGLWWVCKLGLAIAVVCSVARRCKRRELGRRRAQPLGRWEGNASKSGPKQASSVGFQAALDSGKQPARLLLVDSISDNSGDALSARQQLGMVAKGRFNGLKRGRFRVI